MIFTQAIQSDNKVIIHGAQMSSQTLRLNTDGSKDNSWVMGSGFTSNGSVAYAYTIKQIGDALFFGGNFDAFNGTPTRALVSLNMNGSIKKTFNTLPAQSEVHQIESQSDGKMILRGYFPLATGNYHLVRINSDGTLDNSFENITVSGYLGDIAIDANDNIYAAGSQLNPNGALMNGLIRLRANGSLDPTFNISSLLPVNTFINCVEVLPNSKVAIGGWFDSMGSQSMPAVALFNSDATLSALDAGLGKGSAVMDMKYKDGALYLLGKLFSPDFKSAFGVTKLTLSPSVAPLAPSIISSNIVGDGNLSFNWSNSETGVLAFVVEKSINGQPYAPIDTVDFSSTSISEKIERENTYSYRVRAFNDIGFSPYSNTLDITWNPEPIGAIIATGINDGLKAVIQWQSTIKYHDGFRVERSASINGPYDALETLPVTATSFTQTLTEGQTFFYRVVAYNTNGLVTSDPVAVVITDIQERESRVALFPNPTTDKVYLGDSNSAKAEIIHVQAIDGKIYKTSTRATASFDVSHLPNGTYILHYRLDDRLGNLKFIKK